MSTFYKDNNNETAFELFNKNILYRAKVSQLGTSNLIDFNFGEKAFYGKTNRRFVPVVLNPNVSILKGFKSSAVPEQNLQALGFVVDSFEALSQQFKKAQQLGKIDSNDQNLTNLKVFKSYVNYNITYQDYQNNFISALQNNLDIRGINNFQQFVKELLRTVSIVTKAYPMSMPAYVKSKNNSLTNTGFAIEIADAPYNNDDQKISQFVESKNWEFYVNACNSYGFMIDINAPWRLIADIDSEAMIGYASKYGLINSDRVLNFNFKTIHNEFFNNLPSLLLNLYNQIVPRFILTNDDCGSKTIKTERYTLNTINENYNTDFFLDFYFNLRFSEEENSYSEAERQRIMKDCRELAVATTTRNALNVFENYVNQPFDYRGSLSYLNKARRLREDT